MLVGSGEGGAAKWHCYEVQVKEGGGGTKYTFACKKWIRVAEEMDMSQAILLNCDEDHIEEGKLAATRSACLYYHLIYHHRHGFLLITNSILS